MTNTSTHPDKCIGNVTTDTPRTDAVAFSSRDPLELMQTSQQIERELAASKAEVERLRELLEKALTVAQLWAGSRTSSVPSLRAEYESLTKSK
jgi:hypothetical protein